MKPWTAWVAGAACGVAAVAFSWPVRALQDAAPAGGGARSPGVCTAFLNLNRVFQAHPRVKKLQDDLASEADLIKTGMANAESDLRKEAGDLQNRFEPGTADYEEGLRRITLKRAEADYDGKRKMERLQRRSVTGIAAAYEEIKAEAERIAKARGFQAVLTYDDQKIAIEDQGQSIRPSELMNQMVVRTVLWGAPEGDITREVIAALAADPPKEGEGGK